MAEVNIKDQFREVWDRTLLSYNLSSQKILVAGASGLIGSCLVKVLLNHPQMDFQVYALGRSLARLKNVFAEYTYNKCLHLIAFDISTKLDLNIKFDYIIDCASNANPASFNQFPIETIMSNILGVDNLLSYGLAHSIKRFLYVSSGEVYGELKKNAFEENDSGFIDCTNPRSCYPTSKRTAENLCIAYHKEHGADVVIARPCHIYGPFYSDSDDRAYAQFFRKACSNQDIILNSDGLLKRSWCYVVDCASAILYILLKGENGEAYNISDTPMTIREFASCIAKIANVNVKFNVENNNSKPIISRGILSSDKLNKIGWLPRWNYELNIRASLNYLKFNSKNVLKSSTNSSNHIHES